MRFALILAFMATAALAHAADGRTVAPPAKLEIKAPEKVLVGSGYVKVSATGAESVVFDLFSVFEDTSIKLQSEVLGGVLIIGIPASPGAIRVTAAGVIAGKPAIASAVITVGAKDTDKDKPDEPGKPAPPVRLHCTVIGLSESAALKKALAEAGVAYWPYGAVPSNRPDLAKQAQRVGTPCVIVQGTDGKVLAARKISSDQDVANAVNEAGK